jgi:hypothetical protein
MNPARLAVALAVFGCTTAAAIDYPYPGDDWQLHKPGTKDDKLAHDYAECIRSPMAPPIIDLKTMKVPKDINLVTTHRRFILACMGTKGYVLIPPK